MKRGSSTLQNALKIYKNSLVKIPPTHPCISMKKKLKDLASEKMKFKLCKKL